MMLMLLQGKLEYKYNIWHVTSSLLPPLTKMYQYAFQKVLIKSTDPVYQSVKQTCFHITKDPLVPIAQHYLSLFVPVVGNTCILKNFTSKSFIMVSTSLLRTLLYYIKFLLLFIHVFILCPQLLNSCILTSSSL